MNPCSPPHNQKHQSNPKQQALNLPSSHSVRVQSSGEVPQRNKRLPIATYFKGIVAPNIKPDVFMS